LVTGMKILVPLSGLSHPQGICCEHPGQRHREHEGAGRPIRTLRCELELVAGRLCDSPATTGLGPVAPSVVAAESANP
jgi:hypothetical protein